MPREQTVNIEIRNDLLYMDGKLVEQRRSPNVRAGVLVPKFLVMHCSEGNSFKGTVDWLTSAESQASAHLVVGKDLEVAQLVPFNKIAVHAGVSDWQGEVDMSKYSIGIELDNPAYLETVENPQAGRAYKRANRAYKPENVVVTKHRKATKSAGWHKYPRGQIDLALEISVALVNCYRLVDFLGHDEISKAKQDPGPLFPIRTFRKKIFGREEPIRKNEGDQS